MVTRLLVPSASFMVLAERVGVGVGLLDLGWAIGELRMRKAAHSSLEPHIVRRFLRCLL